MDLYISESKQFSMQQSSFASMNFVQGCIQGNDSSKTLDLNSMSLQKKLIGNKLDIVILIRKISYINGVQAKKIQLIPLG